MTNRTLTNLIATIAVIIVLAFSTSSAPEVKTSAADTKEWANPYFPAPTLYGQPQQQEKAYAGYLTLPEWAALFNGLKKSTAPYSEVEYLMSKLDGQLQPQIKAEAARLDSSKLKTKKP